MEAPIQYASGLNNANEGKFKMIEAHEIKEDMPVVTAQAEEFAVVDHTTGPDTIKLKKDDSGIHHYIPVTWVISTEGGVVKINRTLEQVKKEWTTQAMENV
jgi:hypothetical protein